MSRKLKVGREKRKKANKNNLFTAFVTNKWNGKEAYEDFLKREFKVWNNLPSRFKRISLTKEQQKS